MGTIARRTELNLPQRVLFQLFTQTSGFKSRLVVNIEVESRAKGL